MRLEYRYDQIYYTDLHSGDMISVANGQYIILTENDINEKCCLKQPLQQVSNNLEFNKNKELIR